MNFTEFKTAIREAVNVYFSGSAETYLESMTRVNSTVKEALVIEGTEKKISPMIYLEELYDAYKATGQFDKCVEAIVQIYNQTLLVNEKQLPVTWTEAVPRIQMKIINKEWNGEKLKEIPYIEYLDFAIIFYVFLKEMQGMIATMTINREMMEKWKVDTETLCRAALENLRKEEFEVVSMDALLQELIITSTNTMTDRLPDKRILAEDKCGLYVLRNQYMNHSARGILRKDILRRFAEKHDGSFFILPSSINELLFLKDNGKHDVSDLKEMVQEINSMPEIVNPDEKLSDSIYYYSREKDEVEIVA